MGSRISGALAAIFLWAGAAAEPPKITAFDRAQGWRLLFDGHSWSGWHGFGAKRVPANWEITDSAIVAREEGRALVSDGQFADFELTFHWRMALGGRAEVYFRLSEDEELPARTGPVFQLAGPDTEVGGNGGLIAPGVRLTERPGEWQSARLVVTGEHVEHWIAGQLVLSYVLGSAEWRAAVGEGRYAAYRGYGRLRDGPIAFAGRGAEFRDVKVRGL